MLLEPIEIGSSGEFVSLFPLAGLTTNGDGEDADALIDEAESALSSANQSIHKTYHFEASAGEDRDE